MTGRDDQEEVRHAVWDLLVALHNLAAGHAFGTAATVVDAVPAAVHDATVTVGDVDDVLQQLHRHQIVLDRAHPELTGRIREVVERWDERRADRLVELLPFLDRLQEITGASLPAVLPPTER